MNEFINELTPDMIPEGIMREIAEKIGIENFIKLAELIGGTTFYLPKADAILRPIRDQKIKQDFNGYNHIDLAKKYNLSERWIRNICGEGFTEGQITLFDSIEEQEKSTA